MCLSKELQIANKRDARIFQKILAKNLQKIFWGLNQAEDAMPALPIAFVTISLLIASNIFMTFAWYRHLKFKGAPLYLAILISWGSACF